jgi:hypothetical protein
MGRGPSYPYVDLEEAVALTRKVYDFTRKSAAPLESVIKEAWEYSPTSSSGEKVLAALKAFGLAEEMASGDAKMLKISDRAYRILVDDATSPERRTALREAALAPKWYKFCWEKWGSEMPPSMRSTLIFEHGFVETTVDKFVQDYRKSIQFGGVAETPDKPPEDKDSKSKNPLSLRIGDLVQWESQGAWQFPEPKKIVRFSDDEKYAFFDGSNSGIPVDQLLKQDVKPKDDPPPPGKGRMDITMRQDIFSLAEGDIKIQWPASISEESYQDVADWLKILERKIKRSVAASAGETE